MEISEYLDKIPPNQRFHTNFAQLGNQIDFTNFFQMRVDFTFSKQCVKEKFRVTVFHAVKKTQYDAND